MNVNNAYFSVVRAKKNPSFRWIHAACAQRLVGGHPKKDLIGGQREKAGTVVGRDGKHSWVGGGTCDVNGIDGQRMGGMATN